MERMMTVNGAKPKGTKSKSPKASEPPSRVAGDWREETLARMRALILEADPEMTETRKWKKPSNGMVGVPVWSHGGIVCTGETYKAVVKFTFAKGASLPDRMGLFNASLEGSARRAIDIREGEQVHTVAFKALVKAAVARNAMPTPRSRDAESSERSAAAKKTKPGKLLSGGNPQIAKADGDAPVQAFIAAMPGWKRDIGQRLDALIVRTVPNVQKAVRWNSPFYGSEGQGWFLGIHCFAKYIKVAFFRGTALSPMPPVESKQKEVRYLHVFEDAQFDEAQFARWVKQASELPGERM